MIVYVCVCLRVSVCACHRTVGLMPSYPLPLSPSLHLRPHMVEKAAHTMLPKMLL